MYIPSHFREEDQKKLHEYIREYGFGLLIVSDDAGVEANHVPFYLKIESKDSQAHIQCHMARNNPVWQRIENGAQVLAVFQGPDAYVSPSWYPAKRESGRVVPTWNYLAVHVQGAARVIHDPTWLKQHLRQLTDHHESTMATPWSVDDAPADFTDRLVQAIVGVEIKIESLTGKLKASQNRPEKDRAGVRAGLEGSDRAQSRDMAKLVS